MLERCAPHTFEEGRRILAPVFKKELNFFSAETLRPYRRLLDEARAGDHNAFAEILGDLQRRGLAPRRYVPRGECTYLFKRCRTK